MLGLLFVVIGGVIVWLGLREKAGVSAQVSQAHSEGRFADAVGGIIVQARGGAFIAVGIIFGLIGLAIWVL